ncbi:iron-containing alcohol dehydrogenase [Hwanghaeella sp.]|uniref:iron-containing alcohol dehydrogenase n=1 Tax=Hwanghaeella sp. TaxID=2605943 RepID=UPI003CCC0CF9
MISPGHIVFTEQEEIIYGKPAATAVADSVERYDARRVLIMASGTLARETDEVRRIKDALGSRCIGTFAEMPPHTPRTAVIKATAQARAAQADLIVTLGGGSITDGAKAVQLCLANGLETPEAMDLLRDPERIQPPNLRQVSIPTTLSGGEFSAIAGVTNEATTAKEIIRHPDIIPRTVILDPAVTIHTPAWLWTSTGIRAVDHCVEGICSNEANPYGDAQALKALALLAKGLPRVHADPSDLDARLECQLGTWLSMGPLSSGVPMGASHGIGYVLGAAFNVPHGHTSCVMLPAAMAWNKPANAEKQEQVAAALGRPGTDAAEALGDFIGGLGQPRRLSEIGITSDDDFARIAEQAMSTPWVPRNPRPIKGPGDVLEILNLAR